MSTKKIPRKLFSERLKLARMRLGLNGAKMADFLGVSQPVYSRYENGRIPEINVLAVISQRCRVTLDWLLGLDELQLKTTELPGSIRETQSDIDQDKCKIPDGCDLPGRLEVIEKEMADQVKQLDDIRKLLLSLLAEEREKNAPHAEKRLTEKAG